MAKINSTLNGGYYTPDDMDVDALKRLAKRRAREEAEALEARGIDATSKRMTFMAPFNIVCKKCTKTISKGTKFYASVTEAPEKYLGRVKIAQRTIRCQQPGCGNKIRFVVNPETMTYDVVEGGTGSEIQQKQMSLGYLAQAAMNRGESGQQQEQQQGQQNGSTLESLTSFEDVRALLFAESEAIDALGDNYMEEGAQVKHIMQRVLQQQREKMAREKLRMEQETEQLNAAFEKAKLEMSALGRSSMEDKPSVAASSKKVNVRAICANALAETKALFVALERVSSSAKAATNYVPPPPQPKQAEPEPKQRKGLFDFDSD